MSVPIHNLYDFVYHTLEKSFELLYFYPYGQKHEDNVVQHTIANNLKYYNDSDIDRNPIYKLKEEVDFNNHIFNGNSQYASMFEFCPIILCHDQEPLNWNLYKHLPNNLRDCLPFNFQKYWILLHSEINSVQLDVYESSKKFIGAYWWSHAMLSLDWYRYATVDKKLQPGSHVQNTFLVYCRDTTGGRKYRKKFLSDIDNLNLSISKGYLFNQTEPGSNFSAVYNYRDFNETAISVILETNFDNRIHLTEKTCRALACGHPFLLANGPTALEKLRQYGFKTFDPWIDESYDQIENTKHRQQAIVKEMSRIQGLSDNKQAKLFQEVLEIAQFNKEHFFSTEFHNAVVDELITNVQSAVDISKHEIDWHAVLEKYKDKKIKYTREHWRHPDRFERRLRFAQCIRAGLKGGKIPPSVE